MTEASEESIYFVPPHISSSKSINHLLSIKDIAVQDLESLFALTDSFLQIGQRPIPKVPALRAKTVASVFFEPSTRTRISFETAAKRLSADTVSFNSSSSSLTKGESLRDTVETLLAMGVDSLVVRHKSSGVPWQIARWVEQSGSKASVINAGDGSHEHPTQALLDCYTIATQRFKRGFSNSASPYSLKDLHIVIVGDIKHSRVARSNIIILNSLGARITVVGPASFLPNSIHAWPVEVSFSLDEVLNSQKIDVIYLLRIQQERNNKTLLPELKDYSYRYGLNTQRVKALSEQSLIMHPGPMNKGVEISAEVADLDSSLITTQVTNGVGLRMAVLFTLLAGS